MQIVEANKVDTGAEGGESNTLKVLGNQDKWQYS
jgi:hypothetical protein